MPLQHMGLLNLAPFRQACILHAEEIFRIVSIRSDLAPVSTDLIDVRQERGIGCRIVRRDSRRSWQRK